MTTTSRPTSDQLAVGMILPAVATLKGAEAKISDENLGNSA